MMPRRKDWGALSSKECRDELNRMYQEAQSWQPGMMSQPQTPQAMQMLMNGPRKLMLNKPEIR